MNTMRQIQRDVQEARNKMLEIIVSGKEEAIKYLIAVAAEHGSDDTAIEFVCYTPQFMDGDPCRKTTEYRIYNHQDHVECYSEFGQIREEEVQLFKRMSSDDVLAVHDAIDVIRTAMYERCFKEHDDNFMITIKKSGMEISEYDCGY